MGNSPSLPPEKVERLIVETGFGASQIQRLYKRFCYLDKEERGWLEPADLYNIRELEQNPLGDRIIAAFFIESKRSENSCITQLEAAQNQRIKFNQFVKVLSHFQAIKHASPTSRALENKLRFAFSMYDLSSNDMITREEFRILLHKVVGDTISERILDDIVDRTIEEADIKLDGQISFEEFCLAMRRVDINQKMALSFAN